MFGTKNGQLFELIRHLYGLFDVEDYWMRTINDHFLHDHGMKGLTNMRHFTSRQEIVE